ncbi:site-specific integrase [uncultured Pseudoalteromonas sp.]|uniref:tyrosine-type recombinase/integrase n=1 Tax=uncultured Pseudoalteromonas sp. TaxID=114053 RepID=UPI0032B11A15
MLRKKFYFIGNKLDAVVTDESGTVYPSIALYARDLKSRGYSSSTIKVYLEHILRFLNYLHRAYEIESVKRTITDSIIEDIIYSYNSYLTFGVDSDIALAKKIAIENKKNKNTAYSSISVINAALTSFIQYYELKIGSFENPKISRILKIQYRDVTTFEAKKVKENSLLGGVIAKSPDKLKKVRLGILKRVVDRSRKNVRHFPLDCIAKLIDAATSYRDKTIYAFLAASGCRVHECLQLTISDINQMNYEVELNSPWADKSRLKGLSEKEAEQLCWKGRQTKMTFLIEPFKSIFFKNLEKYLRYERNNMMPHKFIFQNQKTGKPYFLSDRSSREKQFKKHASVSCDGNIEGISIHSLRHSYGVYTLNYLPLPQGDYGLNISYVKILMGHASIKSTEVYAKADQDLLLAQIAYANEEMFSREKINIHEIRIKYHEKELKKLEKLLPQKNNKETVSV